MSAANKPILVVAPDNMQPSFKGHFSQLGYSIVFWKEGEDVIERMLLASVQGTPFVALLVDITSSADIDSLTERLPNEPRLQGLTLFAAAPDAREADAQMLTMLGFQQVLLYSQIEVPDEMFLDQSSNKSYIGAEQCILIVSADPFTVRLVEFALKKQKIDYDVAADFQIGRQMATDKWYCMAIVEFDLADFDEVSKLIEAIRHRDEGVLHTPIVIVSSTPERELKTVIPENDMDALLTKPLDTTVLQVRIKMIMESQ